MNRIQKATAVLVVVLAGVMMYFLNSDQNEYQETEALTAERGEHDRDDGEGGGEHGGERGEGGGEHSGEGGEGRSEHDRGEKGEESGTELALNATYDNVRNGARLILKYNAVSNSFIGTVENTTGNNLRRVRVEVHLSNGIELGPTTPANLGPGEKREVKLKATEKGFDGWTAHPEVGEAEHGNGY